MYSECDSTGWNTKKHISGITIIFPVVLEHVLNRIIPRLLRIQFQTIYHTATKSSLWLVYSNCWNFFVFGIPILACGSYNANYEPIWSHCLWQRTGCSIYWLNFFFVVMESVCNLSIRFARMILTKSRFLSRLSRKCGIPMHPLDEYNSCFWYIGWNMFINYMNVNLSTPVTVMIDWSYFEIMRTKKGDKDGLTSARGVSRRLLFACLALWSVATNLWALLHGIGSIIKLRSSSQRSAPCLAFGLMVGELYSIIW